MTGDNAQRQRPGFTLIELLIVAAIFATTSLLATTVFSNIQTTQRAIQGKQRITADGRYVLETIARSVRTGTINYAMFTDSVTPSTTITKFSTKDQDGNITCFRLNTVTKKAEVQTNAVVSCPDSGSWSVFTPDDVVVDALTFTISPTSDPFRAIPRASSNCKVTTPIIASGSVTAGYDDLVGACICRDANDCFSGMSCTATTGRSICTNPLLQPTVTMVITTSTANTAAGERNTSTLQTTVTSRVYR